MELEISASPIWSHSHNTKLSSNITHGSLCRHYISQLQNQISLYLWTHHYPLSWTWILPPYFGLQSRCSQWSCCYLWFFWWSGVLWWLEKGQVKIWTEMINLNKIRFPTEREQRSMWTCEAADHRMWEFPNDSTHSWCTTHPTNVQRVNSGELAINKNLTPIY